MRTRRTWLVLVAGVTALALAVAACGDDSGSTSGTGGATTASGSSSGIDYGSLSGSLTASGASFPDAFYQAAIDAFVEKAPGVDVTYNSVGSGQGKKDFAGGLDDFAGSDSTVKPDDGVAEGSFLYVPTVAAPITVAYNLSDVPDLQLSADTLAKIFQRDVTTWNDDAIAADNPDATLPATDIVVVHRADGSGTTSNFTKYLDKASDAWTLGAGDTVAWPADEQAGQKNTGVAQLVKDTTGAIGYVDLSDADASGLVYASIQNKAGNYVQPTLDAASAALDGATVNEDLSYDPLDAEGADAYPITAPTYLLVKPTYDDPAKGALVKAFVTFVLTDGQSVANEVGYATLPASLQAKALAQIDKVT